MAVVNLYYAVPFDQVLYGGPDVELDVLSYSATQITFGAPNSPARVEFFGQFNFTPTGFLTSGTLAGYTVYNAGIKIFDVSGLRVDMDTLFDTIDTGTPNLLGALLFGGADRFTGSSDPDYLNTFDGNDTINGGAGNDTIWGDLGNDVIDGGADNDLVEADVGNDTIYGGSGNDELYGRDGNDMLEGGSGQDSLYGGPGSDIYVIRDETEFIDDDGYGDGSVDLAQSWISDYFLGQGVENGRIMTTTGGKLTGNGLDNTLNGGIGADTLVGYVGNDSLIGGTGNDSYIVDGIHRITETSTLAAEIDSVFSSANWTLGSNLERLTLTGDWLVNGTGNALANTITGNFRANILAGSAGNDTLNGDGGNDTLDGGTGNDMLDGGAGNDALIGGNGADTYHLRDAADTVSETNASSAGGVDTVLSYLSSHTLGVHIENGRVMNSGTASLTGNGLDNLLVAGAGNNALNGGGGVDTVSYALAGAAVTLSLAVSTGQATGGSGTDTLSSIEGLVGSRYDDQLIGSSAANHLSGGGGKDRLDGGSGNDTMVGGDGSDLYRVRDVGDVVIETNASPSSGGYDTVYSYLATLTLGSHVENGRIVSSGTASLTGNELNNLLYAGSGNNVISGGSGIDTVSYSTAGAAVKVSLAVTTGQVTGGSGNDTLAGLENLSGSAFNDTLNGSTGANVLQGGDGNDLLNGASGNDVLTGGNGADVFRFTSTPGAAVNIDTLSDFSGVDDSIQLENSAFTKLATTGVLSSSNFRASTTGNAVDSNDFVLYETDTGKLFYDADGNGAGAKVQIALLANAPALSHLDIFVT